MVAPMGIGEDSVRPESGHFDVFDPTPESDASATLFGQPTPNITPPPVAPSADTHAINGTHHLSPNMRMAPGVPHEPGGQAQPTQMMSQGGVPIPEPPGAMPRIGGKKTGAQSSFRPSDATAVDAPAPHPYSPQPLAVPPPVGSQGPTQGHSPDVAGHAPWGGHVENPSQSASPAPAMPESGTVQLNANNFGSLGPVGAPNAGYSAVPAPQPASILDPSVGSPGVHPAPADNYDLNSSFQASNASESPASQSPILVNDGTAVSVVPFVSQAVGHQSLGEPRLEGLVDVAYRLRTPLGLALAAVVTAGAVFMFSGRSPGTEAVLEAPSGTASIPVSDGLTEFAATAPESSSLTATTLDGALIGNTGDGAEGENSNLTLPPEPNASTPEQTTAPATVATTASTAASTAAPTTAIPTPTTAAPDATTTQAPATTAAPVTTAAPKKVEAESGQLAGAASVRSDHAGFEGSGFIGDVISEGSGVTVTVNDLVVGRVTLTVRYATPPAGPAGDRSMSVSLNGAASTTMTFANTGDVTNWGTATTTIDVADGTNAIALSWASGDNGWVNIDWIQVG